MKRRGPVVLVMLLALLLAWGIASVYRLRVARGDVFPEYSTLRADPLAARALHDAAKLLPGRAVERWTRPPGRLEAGAGDLVFVIGVRRDIDDETWRALDRAAIAGASVVVGWRAEASRPGDGAVAREMRETPWAEPVPKPEAKEKVGEKEKAKGEELDDEEQRERERDRDAEPPARYASVQERRWGFRLARRDLVTREDAPDAVRADGAPLAWPGQLASWRSDLFFLPRPADGWRPLYVRGGDVVMMRRARGDGAVTLLADSFPLSNEAAQRERATALLADLLGGARRIVFVEAHLGVETEVGVAVLARRYGLGGAAAMALVLAALWFWRRASPLAPVPPEDAELRLSIAPTAGLEALLRRAVPPEKLHEACLEAWRATASAADRRRLENAPRAASATDAVAAHRATTHTLSKKHLL
jgi:hypothetical protein